MAAFQSNLMLTSSGYRLPDGTVFTNGDIGSYWSATADGNGNAKVFSFDNNLQCSSCISVPRQWIFVQVRETIAEYFVLHLRAGEHLAGFFNDIPDQSRAVQIKFYRLSGGKPFDFPP